MVLVAAMALVPPPRVLPPAAAVCVEVTKAWFYFCSMLLGASPFLAFGALAAAAAAKVAAHPPSRAIFARWFPVVIAVAAPCCDCSINALAASLRTLSPRLAAFSLVWGSCCNPPALVATALILGPRVLVCRIIAGAVAAAVTALTWSRLPLQHRETDCAHRGVVESFARSASAAVVSFSAAAAVSAAALALFGNLALGPNVFIAAAAGALLSPCSSADAMLASVLFRQSTAQLAFVVAAQCIDVRQMVVLYRCFGASHAHRAVAAAAVGLVLGCLCASY